MTVNTGFPASRGISALPPGTQANFTDLVAADQVNPTSPGGTGYTTRNLSLLQISALVGGGGGGGSGSSLTVSLTNGSGSTLVPGAPVYISGGGMLLPAVAGALSTSSVIGLTTASIASSAAGAVALFGLVTLTTGQWDAVVTGESGGLTPGANYFLSPTSGKLTTTPPITPGQVLILVGRAISSTTMNVDIGEQILL